MRSAYLTLALLLSISPFAIPAESRAAAGGDGNPEASTPAAPAATVSLAEINDRRAASFPAVRLSFVVPDLKASEVRGQRVLVKEAIDDTGANLVPDGAAEARFEVNYGATAFGSEKEPAAFVVELKGPARAAKALKVVSGEVELYAPGRDPESAVTVPAFASRDGIPFSAAALSANGIEITLLGPKAFAAEKKAAGEAAKKEALEGGDSAEDAAGKATYAEADFLSNFDPRYQTLLKVKDPNGRVGSYAYVDAKGKESAVRDMLISGYTFLTHGTDAPDAGAGLRVQLKTPKNLLLRPFALKDVPLP